MSAWGRFGTARREWRSRRGRSEENRVDVTSDSVLRQKEACREAVEKCRAGRGAHIQWGREWYNTGLQQNSIMSLGLLQARTILISLLLKQ